MRLFEQILSPIKTHTRTTGRRNTSILQSVAGGLLRIVDITSNIVAFRIFF